jgi:regulator of nucleoside diphosphate kinase
VTITSTDRRRLVPLATAALPSERDGVAASMLLSEIGRANIVLPQSLPPNVVTMDCEIEVRDNIEGTIERLRIVFPGEEDGSRHAISVLTQVGAALLGLSEGASIDWCTTGRDRKSFTVLSVCHREKDPVLQS